MSGPPPPARPAIELLRAGPLTTVQDLGRPGWAHLGVPHSGALDRPALIRANELVGNPSGAAGLEITLAGCRFRTLAPGTIALTGADSALTVDGRTMPMGAPVEVPGGATVHVGAARTGVRSYLALAGGVDVAPVLGSRSTDTLSGLGPAPLRDGDRLALAAERAATVPAAQESRPAAQRSGPAAQRSGPAVEPVVRPCPAGEPVLLRLWPGPRVDWFSGSALLRLRTQPYTVGMLSNRVGSRLTGPRLDRTVPDELPSEGIVCGSVQVPADGQPLIFLADHPTTGGYPVIAVLEPDDLPIVAQLRPGATVRFTEVGRWT